MADIMNSNEAGATMADYTDDDRELLYGLKYIVKGNGTKGHEDRIKELETNCNEINCRGKKEVKTHIENDHKGRKAEWIRDVALWLQFLAVAIVLFKLFTNKP
jgi:hypothetical protein